MQSLITRIVLLLAVSFPTVSSAISVNNIFVFGDSLSDNGNVFNTVSAVTSGTVQYPPSPPYAERFSNGPVAVEQYASMLGLNLQPSTAGGTNYAYGGAATGVVPGTSNTDNYLSVSTPLGFLNTTGIQTQVNSASGINFDPNHSLFFIWGGPNDIFTWLDGFSSATIKDVIASAVGNIVQAIYTLKGFGAENFLVPNMVDLGKTPFGTQLGGTLQSNLSLISGLFNSALNQGLNTVADTTIYRPDINHLLQQVQANQGDYGFTNVTDACFDRATFTTCQNPDNYLFWDSVHPTTRADALIAESFYASSTVPEPSVIALMSLVFLIGFRRFFNPTRVDHMDPISEA